MVAIGVCRVLLVFRAVGLGDAVFWRNLEVSAGSAALIDGAFGAGASGLRVGGEGVSVRGSVVEGWVGEVVDVVFVSFVVVEVVD